MSHRIIGFKEAREISMTRKGMNEHATAVVLKSYVDPAKPPEPVESPEMKFEIMKALLGLTDVEKTYFDTLPDEAAATAFLSKSADDRLVEAKAAKEKADALAHAAVLANAPTDDLTKSAPFIELQKTLLAQQEVIKSLTEVNKDKADLAEIEKTARGVEFIGYPGGEPAVVEMLKSAKVLPEASQTSVIDLMKSTAATNRMIAKHRGLDVHETDMSKSAPATAEVEKMALDIVKAAKEKGETVDIAKARGRILSDPANAGLAARAYDEAGIA